MEVLPELERCLNAALVAEIPATIWHHARDIAIEFNDRPCYGKISAKIAFILQISNLLNLYPEQTSHGLTGLKARLMPLKGGISGGYFFFS